MTISKGIQHYEDDDYDGTISDYTKAIQSDPGYVSAWCNRGIVWRQKEDFEKAIADLDEAILHRAGYRKFLVSSGIG